MVPWMVTEICSAAACSWMVICPWNESAAWTAVCPCCKGLPVHVFCPCWLVLSVHVVCLCWLVESCFCPNLLVDMEWAS